MITPRQTRVLRVPDLHAFRRALVDSARRGHATSVLGIRDTAVLVPTTGAARQLRRTFESSLLPTSRAILLPAIVTRAGLYEELAARLAPARRLVSTLEREAIFRAAARDAFDTGAVPPFTLRPGLVAEIVALYDALHRHQRTLARFESLLVDELQPSADSDRGAERLLRQTRFLVATYGAYNRRLDAGNLLDEQRLRALLMEQSARRPLIRLVIGCGDRISEPDGLWPADFDLVTRVPGLEEIDVIATDAVLDAGFHERLHALLPGFEEQRLGAAAPPPTLVAPPNRETGAASSALAFVHRDREEEVADAARVTKMAVIGTPGGRLERTAIVCNRPLPYLYLASRLFESAGVPYEAVDTIPLAAEPYAAAVDLIFSFVHSGYSRRTLSAVLRAPQFRFESAGCALGAAQISQLDRALLDARYIGGLASLRALARSRVHRRAGDALDVAITIAAELEPLQQPAFTSQHIEQLFAFLRAHEAAAPNDERLRARHLRARAAVLGVLSALRDAHTKHDNPVLPFVEVAAIIRRSLEAQTFAPEIGEGGLHIVDAASARFGDFDSVRLVGLVEAEWPEAERRSIFYPASLLTALGWPKEVDRLRAARAMFRDLVRLPRRELRVSTFSLEYDAVVAPSSFLDDVADAGLPIRVEASAAPRVFTHEALMFEPIAPQALDERAAAWLALRQGRTATNAERFAGHTMPHAASTYSVSGIDRYLDCPFKYFARDVLQLQELEDERPMLTPLARGRFIHDVFRRFFADRQHSGLGAVTPETVDAALLRFAEILESALETLPEADRALERTRMLGSAAAPGLADRVLRLEAEQPIEVLERLLEYELSGVVTISDGTRTRDVAVRGVADRIDVLVDGSLRLVDYKLGSASKARQSVQLPVYAVAAEQRLRPYRGRTWRVGEAGYVPFKGGTPFISLETHQSSLAESLQAGQGRFLDAIEGIERGEFLVQPTEPFMCNFCSYASVCRKDYVGDA